MLNANYFLLRTEDAYSENIIEEFNWVCGAEFADSIGADIIMAFDECPPIPSTYDYVRKSMDLTHTWLDRCFNRLAETPDLYGHTQNLFPIVCLKISLLIQSNAGSFYF